VDKAADNSIRRAARIAFVAGITWCLAACSDPGAQDAEGVASMADEPSPAVTAEAIHSRVLVLDAHADIELPESPSRYALPDGESRVSPAKLRAGGVDAVVMSIAVGPGPRDAAGVATARALADAKLAAARALAADPANSAVIATTADEVEAAQRAGRIALILGFQNARMLGADVGGIDEFFAAGVRVFALTHMGHNDFADSSRPVFDGETRTYEPDAEHGGLSPLGKEAIRRINALGGIVDVSQLSKAATLQVLELSTSPVIASHSNAKALTNVRRNLSDEEIDLIGANGGVIHIAAFGGYLFDSSDRELDARIVAARRIAGLPDAYDYPYELYWEIEDKTVQGAYISAISGLLAGGKVDQMLDHLDHIVQRIGVDHVGFGNDFNHGGGIEGFEDASGARLLTEGLLQRGYGEADIARIWGGNFLRVMRAASAAAPTQPD
jgi:membrane dipeptidase